MLYSIDVVAVRGFATELSFSYSFDFSELYTQSFDINEISVHFCPMIVLRMLLNM
jgi:hypothetical protein